VNDLYLSGTNSLSYEVSTQYTTCICLGLIVYNTRYRPSTRLVSIREYKSIIRGIDPVHDFCLLGINTLSYEVWTQCTTCVCQGLIVCHTRYRPVHNLYLSGTISLSYEVSTQCTTCICQGLIVYHTRYRPSTRLLSVRD
jgi:hypothetical protein